MKNLFSLLLCVAAVCCVSTANAKNDRPSGNRITETFDLKGFDGISSSAGIDVHITMGPVYEVTVTTDRKTMEHMDLRVKGGILHIGYKGSVKSGNRETDVFVTMPEVKELSASSGSDIKGRNLFTGQTLKVSASSAADIEATVHYKTVVITCSSGADVELKGEADKCSASSSSGADIVISELQCVSVTASASSGADIELYATENIEASASSGADIRYRGNPKTVDINRSSGGDVKRMSGH